MDGQKTPASEQSPEAMIDMFHNVWFRNDSPLDESEEDFFEPLRKLVPKLCPLSDAEIDTIVSEAASSISRAFPDSCVNEYLDCPSATLSSRSGGLFDFRRPEVFLNYNEGLMGQPRDERSIESPFSQLWLLAASGLLAERHAETLTALLRLEPPEGLEHPLFSRSRWKIWGRCPGMGNCDLVREIWETRQRYGFDDDCILAAVRNQKTPEALKLIIELLKTPVALGGHMTFGGMDYTLPSEFLEGFDEHPGCLPMFFPALEHLIDQVVDPGLWTIAEKCERAGVLPESSRSNVVAQIDTECARAADTIGEAEGGSGDVFIYDALNACAAPFGAACSWKNLEPLSKWYAWAEASKYPEVRLLALQGLLANREPIHEALVRGLAVPFCLSALYLSLDEEAQADLIPDEFLTKAKIAEHVVAKDLDQDGVHFPPNRFREIAEVSLEADDSGSPGHYVVLAATGLTEEEFEQEGIAGAAETLFLIGPIDANIRDAFRNPPEFYPTENSPEDSIPDFKNWARELVEEYA